MNTLQSTMRRSLLWLAPLAVLVALIMWQTEWGHAFLREPPAESGLAAKPMTVSLLPEYQPLAAPDGNRDVVERSLFNPTRRPAPTALAEAKPQLQRGQFALSGTLMTDGKATAFLREVNGGKSRRVAQGETVNGMLVTEIKPDRVRLSLGEETEELSLKLAVGPKATIQPVVAAAAAPVSTEAAAAATASPQVANTLAERRRAAREAEAAAAAGRQPPVPAASAPQVTAPNLPPPPVAVPSTDPQWQSVYRQYQQRNIR